MQDEHTLPEGEEEQRDQTDEERAELSAEARDEPKPGMKVCPTCEGSGKITGGNVTCPECKGSGEVPVGKQQNADEVDTEDREAIPCDSEVVANAAKRPAPRRKERHRSVPLMPEVRFFRADSLEIREEKQTDQIVVSGAPIVYERDYSVTDMFGKFDERMVPGVADDILGEVDTRFLFNHDGLPMARSKNEVGKPPTLTLQDSGSELRFTARLDARQQIANDLWIAIDRGDVTQMSAGFIVARDEWDEAMEHRTIHRLADLLDVSAVTYPASPTTHIQVAQRMAMAMPVESRARLRNLIVADRAGKKLSGANQEKVATAIGALHSLYEAGGGDPSDLIEAGDDRISDDGSEGAPSGESSAAQDGSLARSDTVVDPGEPIRSTKTARVLAMELEARRHRRKAA
ncbi:MAG: caudovirus prohead protease [Acidimicrobiaceae bacterium]|nr:caudovirus prohead protease [Acidimicrobiaceae bacterium]